jgi:hypothetical protein
MASNVCGGAGACAWAGVERLVGPLLVVLAMGGLLGLVGMGVGQMVVRILLTLLLLLLLILLMLMLLLLLLMLLLR